MLRLQKQSHQDEDSDEDNRPETEDEKPIVVALKEGDLSQEEAEHYAKVTGKKLDELGKDGELKQWEFCVSGEILA